MTTLRRSGWYHNLRTSLERFGDFFLVYSFILRKREREHESGRGTGGERENQALTVSTEPDVGLTATNREIMA